MRPRPDVAWRSPMCTRRAFRHRHALGGHRGRVSVVGFSSRGQMGRFDDVVTFAQQTGSLVPNTADVRRYTSRPGVSVNVEQQIVPAVSLFGRAGWADGQLESYEFSDIDR